MVNFRVFVLVFFSLVCIANSAPADSAIYKIEHSSGIDKLDRIFEYIDPKLSIVASDIKYLRWVINNASILGKSNYLGWAYYKTANYYLDKKQLDSAYLGYSLALDNTKPDDKKSLSHIYQNMAIALKNWGARDKAMQSLQMASANMHENEYTRKAQNNYAQSQIYYDKHDNLTALKYINIALDELHKSKSDKGLHLVFYHKANIFNRLKMADSAIYCASKVLEIANKKNIGSLQLLSRNVLAFAYLNKQEYHTALQLANETFEIAKKTNQEYDYTNAYHTLGTVYQRSGNYAQAVSMYRKSYPLLIKAANELLVVPQLDSLAVCLGKLGRYKEQAEIIKFRLNYSDSINTYKVEKGIANIYNQHQIENSVRSVKTLQLQSENQTQIISQQRTMLYAASVISIVIFVLLLTSLYYYKRANKLNTALVESNAEIASQLQVISQNKKELDKLVLELEESNSTKDKLFSIVSHDLKGPISFYSTTLEVFKFSYQDMSEPEIDEWLSSMIDSSKKIIELLKNLLLWSSIQRKNIYFNPDTAIIENLLDAIVSDVSIISDTKKITINKEILIDNAILDSEIVRIIIRNFVANAIRHSENNSVITVRAEEDNGQIALSVIDKASGIAPELLKHINDANHKAIMAFSNSSGIGLLMSHDLAKLHGGRIEFESELGKGTKASFVFPKIIT